MYVCMYVYIYIYIYILILSNDNNSSSSNNNKSNSSSNNSNNNNNDNTWGGSSQERLQAMGRVIRFVTTVFVHAYYYCDVFVLIMCIRTNLLQKEIFLNYSNKKPKNSPTQHNTADFRNFIVFFLAETLAH